MDLSIILPYKADMGLRDRQKDWIVNRYKKLFPRAEIIIADDKTSKLENGHDDFNRAKMINYGVYASKRNNLLITDIDVIFKKDTIIEGLKYVKKGYNVLPYNMEYKLHKDISDKILNSKPVNDLPLIDFKNDIKSEQKNGSNGWHMISKSNFVKVYGYDERFVGWGGEDDVFRSTIHALCDKKWVRLNEECYHLWHECNRPKTKKTQYINFNNPLAWQYINNKNNKNKILKMMNEKVSIFKRGD